VAAGTKTPIKDFKDGGKKFITQQISATAWKKPEKRPGHWIQAKNWKETDPHLLAIAMPYKTDPPTRGRGVRETQQGGE